MQQDRESKSADTRHPPPPPPHLPLGDLSNIHLVYTHHPNPHDVNLITIILRYFNFHSPVSAIHINRGSYGFLIQGNTREYKGTQAATDPRVPAKAV